MIRDDVESLKRVRNNLNQIIESLERRTKGTKVSMNVYLSVDDDFSKFLSEDINNQYATLNKLIRLFDSCQEPVSIRVIELAIGAEEVIPYNGESELDKPREISIVWDGAKAKFRFNYNALFNYEADSIKQGGIYKCLKM